MKNEPNQRNSKQRQVILEELRLTNSHPTAAELYEIVRKQLPKISLGTVYRNLELLVKNKSIKKLEMGGSEARFDGETVNHHHARCVECGAIDDLLEIPEQVVSSEYLKVNNFDIHGYRIEFHGLCPKCKAVRVSSKEKK